MTKKFEVLGMGCAACEHRVIKAVSALDGVSDVIIDLAAKTMTVTLTGANITDSIIIDTVTKAGYTAYLIS